MGMKDGPEFMESAVEGCCVFLRTSCVCDRECDCRHGRAAATPMTVMVTVSKAGSFPLMSSVGFAPVDEKLHSTSCVSDFDIVGTSARRDTFLFREYREIMVIYGEEECH